MTKILLGINALLILMLCLFAAGFQNERAEKERFKANQTTLLSEVEYWATENEKSAADVLKLTLTVDELENSNVRLRQTAEELNIKLKRMQSASTTATENEVRIITQVRDSIVYRDSVVMAVKAFDWADPWTSVSGVIEADSVNVSVCSVDTLTTIVHKIPKRFWFITWGCKAIKQTVVSANPHTKITYNEYIELK